MAEGLSNAASGLEGTADELLKKGMELCDAKNYPQAAPYLQKSADMGNAEAQFQLADLYHCGLGVPEDHEKEMGLYHKSAEQGYSFSQYVLGCYYIDHLVGVPNANKDIAKGIEWFRKAAEQGFGGAYFELGELYRFGEEGVPADGEKALGMYLKGADLGYLSAQWALGMYYFGILEGVPGDDTDTGKGIEWFTKAAEEGHMASQYILGDIYASGKDVPRDKAQAVKWFTLAAEQGDEDARAELEELEKTQEE